MALFGVFGFVGPILEKRYGRRNVESSEDGELKCVVLFGS